MNILWRYFSIRRKVQFWFLSLLMIVSSFLEVASLGVVIPFLGVITAPEEVFNSHLASPVIVFFEFTDPGQLALPITIIFISLVLLAGLVRIVLLYVMTRFSYAVGADISIDIYNRTLFQDYLVHVERNSSEIINSIITKTNTVIGGVVSPTLNLISSTILLVSVFAGLMMVNPNVAMIMIFGFGFLYWLITLFTKKKLKENSECIAKNSTLMVKSLQEGLGGIRDVIIDGSQKFYCQLYKKADLPLRRAAGNNQFIAGSPKYVIEALGMSIIAIIAYTMLEKNSGSTGVIPTLGAFALGAQRLLPALQQAYSAYSRIKGAKASFYDVIELLNQKIQSLSMQGKPPIQFEKYIDLQNVSFQYSKNDPLTLKNINLKIEKGSCVGFVGETGTGKSTLIDIIMGLIYPSNGKVVIDGKTLDRENVKLWQVYLSHVPQNIFLSDNSIEENIAFGIPKNMIDRARVEDAAKQAEIHNTIQNLKNGYKTSVGEHGAKLSGGQRQRLGIARALYRESEVLILDEATSALDNRVEEKIMKGIMKKKKNLTILIIAHRLTTLKDCDYIVHLGKNHKPNIVTYEDLHDNEGSL